MAPHSSTLAWKIPWTEEPGRLQSMGLRRVRHDWVTSLSLFSFTHWWETATHSSVLAWRIPGPGEPCGLPSMGSHRVGHDWSELLAAAAAIFHFEHHSIIWVLNSLALYKCFKPWVCMVLKLLLFSNILFPKCKPWKADETWYNVFRRVNFGHT